MTTIGIDPGFTGAIAILGADGLVIHDMPVFPVAAGRNELNHHGVLDVLRSVPAATVWLERVSAMPGQGVTSVFRFGQGYGALEMACAAAGHSVRYVTPAKWKGYFGIAKAKDAARSLASQRFPASARLFARKKDDGRAEASLVALYGVETGGRP